MYQPLRCEELSVGHYRFVPPDAMATRSEGPLMSFVAQFAPDGRSPWT
jgi:hypothetical protein